jgi:hypothetical protein
MSELAAEICAFPAHVDGRGTLVPIELDEVDFQVRRVFTVTGVAGGSTRGDHVTDCRELIVLVSGEIEVTTGSADSWRRVTLDRPGASIELEAGLFVRYRLRDDRSVILVLTDESYCPRVDAP